MYTIVSVRIVSNFLQFFRLLVGKWQNSCNCMLFINVPPHLTHCIILLNTEVQTFDITIHLTWIGSKDSIPLWLTLLSTICRLLPHFYLVLKQHWKITKKKLRDYLTLTTGHGLKYSSHLSKTPCYSANTIVGSFLLSIK